MVNNLDAKRIIEAIEQQQKALGMTRLDLCALTGIPYATLTSCIQKNKLLRFNDLYLVSLAIGMPVDELTNLPKGLTNRQDNILYWQKFMPENVDRRFLLYFPDKVAIAKTIAGFAKESNPLVLFMPPKEVNKTIADLKFAIFFHMIMMDDFFSVFFQAIMTKEINAFYSVHREEEATVIDYFQAHRQMISSLWEYPYLPIQSLWKTVDSTIPSKYPTTSAFLKEAGINSLTYAKYLNAVKEKSSPGTETAYRACSLLDISDIDSLIRSNLPEITETSSNPYRTTGLIPHKIENPVLADNLRSLPYLAMFFDSLFSLNYSTLSDIYHQIQRVAFSPNNSVTSLSKVNVPSDPSPDNPYEYSMINPWLEADYGKDKVLIDMVK